MADQVLKPGPNAVDITPNQDGGVMKEIITEGKGEEKPMTGDVVTVHYVGKLTDGSGFDSSRDRGEKFDFSLGKGQVIKGWDIGVATMKLGERCNLFIKSEYGYGETGSPPKIPGGATLVFDVELFEFKGEDITADKDGGVVKRMIVKGEGFDNPNDGALVDVTLKGWKSDGTLFDERSALSFEIGEGLEHNIPKGIELGLEKMKRQETAELNISNQYTFTKGWPEKGVAAGESVKYQVQLNSFEKSKENWQLDAGQKLEQAKIFKTKGTNFFKASKFEIAAAKYKKIIDFLEHEISLKGDEEEERKALLQAGRLNLALCKIKLGDALGAKDVCDKVIEENRDVEKAWFRRGECHFLLNDWEQAKTDFEQASRLDPSNKAVKNKVAICEHKIKQYKQKEKALFANMFDKFAARDQKKEDAENMKRPDTMNNIDEWNSGNRGSAAADPNNIPVGGDINMDMDINQAIAEDERQQEEQQTEVNGV